MKMKRPGRRAVFLGAAAVVACLILLFVKRNDPVPLGGDVGDHHGYQLLNPFRSRRPEQQAAAFLAELKGGNCSPVRKVESNPDRVATVCANEAAYPIASWHLEARGYDGNRVLLRYAVRRNSAVGSALTPPQPDY